MLLLLTGPVGAGKSTTAHALADRMRSDGRTAAVIDLDLVYGMARQEDGFADLETWRVARRAASALAAAFFADGMDVVVVEGSFHDEEECADVTEGLSVPSRLFALNVLYETVAQRVADDPAPDRVASRDPNILRWLHTRFTDALPFLTGSGLVIDASRGTPEELAAAIVDQGGL